jgi:hypothetical protein
MRRDGIRSGAGQRNLLQKDSAWDASPAMLGSWAAGALGSLSSSAPMKDLRLRLTSSTKPGTGSRETCVTFLHGPQSTETSSPHVVSLTCQPSAAYPSPRNIFASSLKLNTGSTLLPMVNTSSPLRHCSAINQSGLIPIRSPSTRIYVTSLVDHNIRPVSGLGCAQFGPFFAEGCGSEMRFDPTVR